MTTRRKSANIYDYPEHLNPFHEEDNHNRLRFWTATKTKSRSNSFSFQSIKDFRGSIRFPRSRNRTDTSSLSQLNCLGTKPKNEPTDSSHTHNRFFSTLRKLSRTFSIRKKNNSNSSLDQTSQIDNDDEAEVQLRVSPTTRQTESYSTQKSVTPLPRSRFHERVRHSEPAESKSDIRDLSVNNDDKNPFSDESDEDAQNNSISSSNRPITPARKKKRAPPPPPVRQSSLKAKSLTEYKASKHIVKSETEECNISKDEIEGINTTNNVNIQIKVEDVDIINSNEQNEEIKTSEIKETNDIDSEQTKTIETIQTEEIKIEEEKYQQSIENEEIKITEDKSTIEIDNEIKVTMTKEDTQIEEKEQAEIPEETIPSSESNEEISSAETVPIEEINYNSEMNLSDSCTSLSSETKIEEKIQQAAIEDTSDLLELVTKLKLEVDKLTDDTNNNVIESEEERKVKNIQSWIKLDSPNRVKTEMNVYLDDDDDVICSAPLSPRLVRLRKDNEWIRHQN